MKKRLLAVLLAVTLVFELGEVPAMAQTTTQDQAAEETVAETVMSEETMPSNAETDILQGTWINPAYADSAQTLNTFAKSDGSIASTGATTYSSISSAAKYVKQQMMARSQELNFNITSTSDNFDSILNSIFQKAWAVTSNPQEGDYLRYHIYGYAYNGGYRYSAGEYTYYVKIVFTYQSTSSQETKMKKEIASAVSSLKLSGNSDIQKIKKIHDYICAKVSYDYSYSRHSAYNALCQGSAVCQGYANLFYAMCVKAGISVRSVTGKGNGGDHIWNIVKLGTKWYNVDTTWDSQPQGVYYYYFLKSNSGFGNHTRDTEYRTTKFNSAYPMSTSSYTGSVGSTKIKTLTSTGYNAVKITWNKVSTATRYDIYYSTSKNGSYKKVSTTGGGVVGMTLAGLKTGSTYYFKIRAVSTLTGSTVNGKMTAVSSVKPLPAKVSLKSAAARSRKMKVTWKKVAGASGYQVYYTYSYKGKTIKKTVTVKGGGTLTKTVTNLPKGVKVSTKVRAYRTVSGKNKYGAYSSTKKTTIK